MDEDFVRSFGKLYLQILRQRRNEDYEVNPVQMDRFLEVLRFFENKIDPEFDDGIEPFHLEAKEEHGGFNARFCVFDLYGEELAAFVRLLSFCSAVSIDARSDSQICISLTVPNIFVLKEGTEETISLPEFGSVFKNDEEEEE